MDGPTEHHEPNQQKGSTLQKPLRQLDQLVLPLQCGRDAADQSE